MIPPRTDLDDEDIRLVTYRQAHAASLLHVEAVASISAGIGAAIAAPVGVEGARASIDAVVADQWDAGMADDLRYRAALAALSGIVQQSLRDFLS